VAIASQVGNRREYEMIFKRPWVLGVIFIFFLTIMSSIVGGAPAARDSLTLSQPLNLSVRSEMDRISSTFRVFLTFDDIANTDSSGTFIHQPDLSVWPGETDPALVCTPSTGGIYSGSIDRTIKCEALEEGEVGVTDNLQVRFEDSGDTKYSNEYEIGNGYAPGTLIDVFFVNSNDITDTLDLGIQVSFTAGLVDDNGQFIFGCEDFEGFHVWRGIEPDGSDLVAIAELSKEEAVKGSSSGGSVVDSVYFLELIPELRESGVFFFPFTVDCLGNRIAVDLEDNEFFWYDCNAYNGFTYYYLITTFDRGYNIPSGTQGLQKIENCLPVLGEPYTCPENLVPVTINVENQDNLTRIFAVPNPYRTGGSVFTTQNYHNFPDRKIRFVNVPAECLLRIYTVSGDLIWETEYRTETDGNIEWEVKNQSGEDVASGIYVYKIENSKGDHVYGRLIVIR
jgi:hypothetical protein